MMPSSVMPPGPVTLAYPLAVRAAVPDLAAAERVLSAILAMPVCERGAGWLRLDNGSICLWLVERAREQPAAPLHLVLSARDVAAAVDELLRHGELQLVHAPRFVATARLEAELRAGDWLTLGVGCTLDEDQLGIVPELVTQLCWEDDARTLLKALLRHAPIAFRDLARSRSVARAEEAALAAGEVVVSAPMALAALVHVTPRFQHALLREALASASPALFAASASLFDEARPS